MKNVRLCVRQDLIKVHILISSKPSKGREKSEREQKEEEQSKFAGNKGFSAIQADKEERLRLRQEEKPIILVTVSFAGSFFIGR